MRVLDYESTLPRLLWLVTANKKFATSVKRTCVVRDLRGRLRLVLEPNKDMDLRATIEEIDAQLVAELQTWYVSPSLKAGNNGLLGTVLFDRSEDWPRHWPQVAIAPDGDERTIDTTSWRALQAVHSKQSWISQDVVGDPWPLHDEQPAVVTFFSYKGGVGRTTTLAAVAWQLARSGKNVIAIDLDLEAPGLGQALGVDAERGVIDYLLGCLAAGEASFDEDLVQTVTIHDATLRFLAAGRLDDHYLEKLARLDFASHEFGSSRGSRNGGSVSHDSPQAYLRQLLSILKDRYRPHYIILDSRAGLHDIGGVALHELGHVAVLVGRHNAQGLAGLEIALRTLGRRRARASQRIAVVHTYAVLPADSEEGRTDRLRYREAVYDRAKQYLYAGEEELPALDDVDGSHYTWAIGQYDELPKADGLARTSLAVLQNDELTALRRRIEELALSEDIDDTDDSEDDE
jgi:MinD-like ATPase involved in chromosome partitioning or flagellar assembly